MLKAGIVQQIQAIGICKSQAHKTFLMDILKSFVKSQNLVNLVADAPKKPRELLEFESKQTPPPPPPGGGPSAANNMANAVVPKGGGAPRADRIRQAVADAVADAPKAVVPQSGGGALKADAKKNLFAFGNTSL